MDLGKFSSSTPARTNFKNVFTEKKLPSDIGSPPQTNLKKSKVLDLIVEAIKDIGLPRKGASCQAIKKWIIANKGSDPQRLKSSFKIALKKGIDEGILQRPQSSSTAVGATGFFMLAKLAKQKPPKSSKGTVIKPAVPLDKTKVLSKANVASNDDGKKGTKVKPSSKKNVAKNSKISPKQDVVKFEKAPSKVKTKKTSPKKAPPKARAVKKPASKVTSKANAADHDHADHDEEVSEDDRDLSGTESEEDPATTQVISTTTTRRGKLARNDALVFSESDEEPAMASEAATKRKPAKTKANDFTESEKGPEIISEPSKIKAKAPAKNKTEKNNATKVKDEDASSVKSKKGIVDRETKKLTDVISSDQVNAGRKNAKKVGNRKLYEEPKDEVERHDFSDTEIKVKNKHFRAFKTFASDSEFEISKSEEKKPKRAGKGKRNASKL